MRVQHFQHLLAWLPQSVIMMMHECQWLTTAPILFPIATEEFTTTTTSHGCSQSDEDDDDDRQGDQLIPGRNKIPTREEIQNFPVTCMHGCSHLMNDNEEATIAPLREPWCLHLRHRRRTTLTHHRLLSRGQLLAVRMFNCLAIMCQRHAFATKWSC